MMFSASSLRSSCQCVRSLSLGRTLARNHYDSLGISPTATQADIKDAYYKLSMQYHPDKRTSENDDAVQKFRDITEAYEVLGNVRLRRLYDKGVSDVGDLPLNKFYKSREKRSRPPSTGRTPIYDFDEWSRQHYAVLLRKEREFKQKVQEHKEAKKHEAENVQMSRVVLVMVLLLAGFSLYSNTGHDHVRHTNQDVTPPSNPK